MGTQRQEQKNQTKRHLINVSIRVLAKNGLLRTKTSDIAKEGGVSHGTVFAHFPTREILLAEVIEEVGSRIASRLHELAVNGGSVREVLAAHLEGLLEYEAFYTRLVVENNLLPGRSQHTLIMIQSAISIHLNQAVEREVNLGTFRSFPTHLLFNTWIGLLHYYLVNADLFSPNESVLQRHGQTLINHFLSMASP
ncbi:MAG: Fatty acid metabolism regulator protein [Candidatus Dichloromethanomonas elyunquensis]|nr:MAG: Fatty acid metabolism regulator protein [Candidatus Dichloromethanomonas elyunquensis]